MKIITSNRFDRSYKRVIGTDAKLEDKVNNVIKQLGENPFEPNLKTHKLKGKLAQLWACKVTDDLRIIFEFVQDSSGLYILLISIGRHDEVY